MFLDDSKLYIALGVGIAVVIIVLALVRRVIGPPRDLGAVSQQWLSEHQADRE